MGPAAFGSESAEAFACSKLRTARCSERTTRSVRSRREATADEIAW